MVPGHSSWVGVRKEGCNQACGPPAAHLGPAQGQAPRAECGWGVCKPSALIHLSGCLGVWGSQAVAMSFWGGAEVFPQGSHCGHFLKQREKLWGLAVKVSNELGEWALAESGCSRGSGELRAAIEGHGSSRHRERSSCLQQVFLWFPIQVFFLSFWLCYMACRIFVPQPGIDSGSGSESTKS